MNNIALSTDRWLAMFGFCIGVYTIGREFELERWQSLLTTCVILLALINVLWFKLWIESDKTKISYEQTSKRDKAISFAKEARHQIYTTHFAQGEADAEYDAVIERKLKDCKFKVVRLIEPEREQDKTTKQWLSKYRVHDNYREVPPLQKLPFDFTIFDDKRAILYFPKDGVSNDFDMCMYIQEPEIVRVFTQLFAHLKTEYSLLPSPLADSTGASPWLLDAFHVPYLVIEGAHNGNVDDISRWVIEYYSYTHMSTHAKTFWVDEERIVLAIKQSKFAICYFISGETGRPTGYLDIISGLRMRLDNCIADLEFHFKEHNIELKYNKTYLQDAKRNTA